MAKNDRYLLVVTKGLSMAIHVFYKSGHDPRTALVEAESEVEARGYFQQAETYGLSYSYLGTAQEVVNGNSPVTDAENVLFLDDI